MRSGGTAGLDGTLFPFMGIGFRTSKAEDIISCFCLLQLICARSGRGSNHSEWFEYVASSYPCRWRRVCCRELRLTRLVITLVQSLCVQKRRCRQARGTNSVAVIKMFG